MSFKLLSGLHREDIELQIIKGIQDGYTPVFESYQISTKGNHYIFMKKGDIE